MDLLDIYFKSHKYPFTSHHLDSFRELIKTYIPKTIQSYNPITMIKYNDDAEVVMKVDVYVGGKDGDQIFVDRPIIFEDGNAKLITPNDARLKNLTYESHLYANILIEITDIDDNITQKVFENVAIGSIPIMLHSDICILNGQGSEVLRKLGECVYDTGGYFIIDGKEKVIIAQERIVTNRLFVSKIKDDQTFSHKGLIRCTGESGETMLSPRSIEFYLVKNPNIEDEDDVIEDYRDKKGAIMVSLPSVTGKIPLFTFFRALGIESDKDIFESIFGSEHSAVEKTFFDNFIRPSVCNNPYKIYTQEDALNYLRPLVKYGNMEHVKNILTTDVFPNIPVFQNKGKFLGYIVRQFVNVCMNIAPVSDRDSYIYKRVDISGYLLAELFQEAYMKLRKFIRDKMDSMYHFGSWNQKQDYENFVTEHNIYKLVPNLLIAQTFAKSLKGMWGIVDEEDPELGKVQDLARISYIGFMSHLRRVNMPLDRSIKVTAPHKLHPQQFGIMCPFETPDGASVGYMKNLAFLTKIASGTSTDNIRRCLLDIGIVPIKHFNVPVNKDICRVLVNGSWFGITRDPMYILRVLKAYRRNSLINVLISISWHIKLNEIRILTEAGRPCRPLIIADRMKALRDLKSKSWFDLISGSTLQLTEADKTDEFYYRNEYINPEDLPVFSGMDFEKILKTLEKNAAVIEYLDIEEEDTCLLAMQSTDISVFHTHLEIHPSTMLSIVSANIPLSNHNQSARNVFHGAQSKQAIGVYATNFNSRFDTMAYVHHYPQRQIIGTQLSQYTCSSYMPYGFNVIAAIMTYSGFNQEDSIMINQKSVERGLFNLSYYKSISGTAKEVSQYERVIFGNPKDYVARGIKVNGIKHANYSLLDDRGFIKEGSYVSKGQRVVAIGMMSVRDVYKEVKKGVFTEMSKETVYSDMSITTDDAVYGFVNKVFYSTKTVGNNSSVCKVRFLKIRKPELGDKLSSSHGQKGTVGMIIPEENMPFTKDGIRPDIIINPHAIPSRMTIGHLVEKVFAKLCCMQGALGNGSVFIPFDENDIYEELGATGFEKHGNEILYNGFTGQQIHTEIFIGPIFYMRLKHMVADKINVRGLDRDKNELPKVMLTRQPTAGKRKGGGLRIGEMERDSIISHGTALFLQESMMERSDKYRWAICKNCGTQAIYNPKKKNRMIKCKLCGNDSICLIQTPYAFKLWSQELQAMGIEMRLNTQKIELPPKRTIEEGDEQDDDMIFGGDGIVSLSDRYNHSGGTIKPLEGTEGEGSEVGEDGEGEGQALNGNGDDDSDGEGQALNGNGNDDSDGDGEGQALNGNGDDDSDSDGEGQALNGNGDDDSDSDGEGQALNGNGDDDSDGDGEGQALNGNGDDDSDSDSFGDGEGFDDSDGFDEGEDDGEQDGHTGGVSKEDIKIVQLDI
jgi:DNA-directed RNA polymerase II subunit RPB2